jgi:hypothetical protein
MNCFFETEQYFSRLIVKYSEDGKSAFPVYFPNWNNGLESPSHLKENL